MPKEKCFNLKEEKYRSKFLNDLLKDEYSNLVKNNYFVDNHIVINNSYIIENEDIYELGIYITNNSNKSLFLKELPISLVYNKEKLITKTLKLDNKIDGNEAIFLEVQFSKEEISEKIENIDDLSISVREFNNINRFIYKDIDYLGLDKVRETSSYKEIKKFIKNLSLVEKGKLALDIFTCGEIEEGLFIVVLIRNYYNDSIAIKSLPLEIYTEDNNLFYKNTVLFNDNGIEIEANAGVFKVILIPKNEIELIYNENSHSYKVKIINWNYI